MARNVLLVENMEHNLLSISQTCDKGHYMIFDSKHVKSKMSKQISQLDQLQERQIMFTFQMRRMKTVILDMKMKAGYGIKDLDI